MNSLLNNLTEAAECWLYSFIGVGVVVLLTIIGVFCYKKIKSPCSKNQSDGGESLQALKREIAQYIPIVTKLCAALQEFGEDEQDEDYSKYDTSIVAETGAEFEIFLDKNGKYLIEGQIYSKSFSAHLTAKDQRAVFSVNDNGYSNAPANIKEIMGVKYLQDEIREFGYIVPEIDNKKYEYILIKPNCNTCDAKLVLKDFRNPYPWARKETKYCQNVFSTTKVKTDDEGKTYYIYVEIAGKEICIAVPKNKLVFSKDGLVSRDSVYKIIAAACTGKYLVLQIGEEINFPVSVENKEGHINISSLFPKKEEETEIIPEEGNQN